MNWITARIRSFGYAFKGIWLLFRDTQNARIHLFAMICVIVAGVLLQISLTEWCAVSLCIGGVLAAEAFNSAIESIADKVSPEKNELIGKAKDLGAGAVLLMAIAAATVGLIIFIPKLVDLCR